MNQDKIWQHFQDPSRAQDSVFRAKARYTFLAQQIEARRKALNIGVGRGGLEKLLVAKRVITFCVDPHPQGIAEISATVGSENAKVGYSESIPFASSMFDVVVMSEVLEHLSTAVLDESLVEVARVLKPGGRFIGTVPADELLSENEAVCPDCGKVFHRWGHQQSFSTQSLQALLERQFADPIIGREFFSDRHLLNWKGQLTALLKQVALRMGVEGAGETLTFSCLRR